MRRYRQRRNVKQGILIALVVIFGLSAIAATGKVLDDEYKWVQKTHDFFIKTDSEEPSVTSEDLTSEDTDSENPSEATPEGQIPVRKIGFEVSNAFGETGKKTVTLNIQPANADVGLVTWSVDNLSVKITPSEDGKSAEVYVTSYFADYATLSVHESYSNITATAKVYSYGAYDIPTIWGNDYTGNLFDANGKTGLLVTSANSMDPATPQKKHLFDREYLKNKSAQLSYYGTTGLLGGERALMGNDWVSHVEKVWLHITFVGSYAPIVYNQTTGVIYNGNNFTTYNSDMHIGSDIGNILTIEMTLADGDNMLLIAGRNHSIQPTEITTSDFTEDGFFVGTKLTGAKTFNYSGYAIPLILTKASAPTGMSLGDLTFTE